MELVTFRKMFNRGVLWCIVFFMIVRTSIFAFDCSEVHGCSCSSYIETGFPADKDILNISCDLESNSSFIVKKHRTNAKRIEVQCINLPKWSNFHVNMTSIKKNHKSSIEFYECDFPLNTISLREITQMLGITDANTLIFTSCNLIFPTNNYLNGFDNLTNLRLDYNKISYLAEDLLANTPYLDYLVLTNNTVNISAGFFNNAPKLEYLVLTYSDLQLMEPGIFDNLKQLSTFDLSIGKNIKFPTGIFDQLTALKTLSISRTNLTSFPEDIFAKLENLRSIYLRDNYYVELPRNLLRNNTKLWSVNIFNNQANLATMPSGFFSNFTELGMLLLNENGFVKLPYDLFWGSFSLHTIELMKNRLKSLPENIFQDAGKLHSLKLDMNELEELPDNIFKYTNELEILSLAKNRIRSITKHMLNGLFNLVQLNLEDNYLMTISNTSLDSISNLKIARFSNNSLMLQSFKDISTKLSTLNFLYLAHNNISDSFSLEMIKNDWLEILNLTYNKISVLNVNYSAKHLSKYIQIDLAHNKIEHIHLVGDEADSNTFVGSINEYEYNTLSVANNPVICDCSFYDYLRYIQKKRRPNIAKSYINMQDLRCHIPKSLEYVEVMQANTFECMAKDANLGFSCPRECVCILRPEDKALRFDCSNENLTKIPRDVKDPGKPYKFIGLNFSYNMLKKMPNLTELNLQSAKLLDLSYNNISEVSQDGLSDAIEVLKLHNNNISRIHLDVLKFLQNSTNLTKLTLHENPWKCDCEAKDFLNFVKVLNLSEVKCPGKNYSMSHMTVDDFCPDEMDLFIGISVLIPVVLIPIVGIIIGVFGIYYRYQRNIKVWLFARRWCLYCVTEEELDKEKLYDAFISYSHKDEDFVENELIPTLESGPKPFKLCVHYRDWLAGEWITTQIVQSVENSRRTIFVLSPNFLDSVWGRMEFRAAHNQALRESRARVILILYGDINPTDDMDPELKLYLNMNTYLKWGDPWFWKKLRYALPHPPRVVTTNEREILENHQMNQMN